MWGTVNGSDGWQWIVDGVDDALEARGVPGEREGVALAEVRRSGQGSVASGQSVSQSGKGLRQRCTCFPLFACLAIHNAQAFHFSLLCDAVCHTIRIYLLVPMVIAIHA